MKKIIFLISLIGLTQFSCKKADTNAPIPTSLEGQWRMIIVKDNSSGSVATKPSSIQGDVDITFTSTSTTKGTFIGNTPTNEIGQNDYSVTANQGITIADLSMTKVMETSWGNEFVNNIHNSQTYSFEVGGNLNIKTANKILTFRKL